MDGGSKRKKAARVLRQSGKKDEGCGAGLVIREVNKKGESENWPKNMGLKVGCAEGLDSQAKGAYASELESVLRSKIRHLYLCGGSEQIS